MTGTLLLLSLMTSLSNPKASFLVESQNPLSIVSNEGNSYREYLFQAPGYQPLRIIGSHGVVIVINEQLDQVTITDVSENARGTFKIEQWISYLALKLDEIIVSENKASVISDYLMNPKTDLPKIVIQALRERERKLTRQIFVSHQMLQDANSADSSLMLTSISKINHEKIQIRRFLRDPKDTLPQTIWSILMGKINDLGGNNLNLKEVLIGYEGSIDFLTEYLLERQYKLFDKNYTNTIDAFWSQASLELLRE